MTEVIERPDVTVWEDVDLEIEPACCGMSQGKPCELPPSWACRVKCGECEKVKQGIYCDFHIQGMVPNGYVRCHVCQAYEVWIISKVPL